MVGMIIKGLFRRYERWNPVHPTSGAFWGMGIGFGCGVGWGPGFGPEVVGYVGAGCGAGFSVGITLAGLGIGLPADYVYKLPYNAFLVTKNGALEIAQPNGIRIAAVDGWDDFKKYISRFQQRSLPTVSISNPFEKGFLPSNLTGTLVSGAKPLVYQFERIWSQFFHFDKGSKG